MSISRCVRSYSGVLFGGNPAVVSGLLSDALGRNQM